MPKYPSAVPCCTPGCWRNTRAADVVCNHCAGRREEPPVPATAIGVEELSRFHTWVQWKGEQFGVDAEGLERMGFPVGVRNYDRWRQTYGSMNE